MVRMEYGDAAKRGLSLGGTDAEVLAMLLQQDKTLRVDERRSLDTIEVNAARIARGIPNYGVRAGASFSVHERRHFLTVEIEHCEFHDAGCRQPIANCG
jgi:hypothetical protein